MKARITLLCCFFLHAAVLKSQVPTEQDCLGAILICDPIYTNNDLNLGQGNYLNEVGPGSCQIQGEINSTWLKFPVIASGDLAFTIYPTSNMDFDWALYNLTYDSCVDIFTNGSLLVSCNSSQYAVTGISASGTGNWNSFGPTYAFNYLLPVNAGEWYYLQLNNFYGAAGGFTIDFTASTATLFNCNVVSFAAGQTSICEKFCTDFFDSSANNPTSWLWMFPGATPSSATDQNPTNICYNNPGSYDVTLITANAAGSDTLTLPNYITVNPTPPLPVIAQSGYTLTSSVASSYQWQLNNVDIPGATNQSYDVSQSGFYAVIITDQHGCVSSSANMYVLITGAEEVNANANVLIYPNPSDGDFTVELQGNQNDLEMKIRVYDMLGQNIFSSEEKLSNSSFKKEIVLCKAMDCASSGIYLLEISGASIKDDLPHILAKKKITIIK